MGQKSTPNHTLILNRSIFSHILYLSFLSSFTFQWTCQSQATGGHLTSISSAEHNEFLVNLATYQGQRTAQFWTGGSHRRGSSLKWTDGSVANFIQRPLSSLLHVIGKTINTILNIRICLKLNINIGGGGNWDGSDCKKKLPFICSYRPNLTPP
ncbi:hypothetical protein JD844_031861 [Phrynosoma platyrhinos]|uniref:C-type lectin domain-containing protein n=1 Tax=Phrynosoma platyrhinos TaxID=52577 RepID=A0ABQ7T4F9_PHRPL|nr:hypothetical protein JD844_031861 [Phrynosoma platyrhinos]